MARKTNQPANRPAARSRRPAVAGNAVDHATIARLAYSFWEARGRQDGSPEQDWFRAERECDRREAFIQGKSVTSDGRP